jgi:hypothetical protein
MALSESFENQPTPPEQDPSQTENSVEVESRLSPEDREVLEGIYKKIGWEDEQIQKKLNSYTTEQSRTEGDAEQSPEEGGENMENKLFTDRRRAFKAGVAAVTSAIALVSTPAAEKAEARDLDYYITRSVTDIFRTGIRETSRTIQRGIQEGSRQESDKLRYERQKTRDELQYEQRMKRDRLQYERDTTRDAQRHKRDTERDAQRAPRQQAPTISAREERVPLRPQERLSVEEIERLQGLANKAREDHARGTGMDYHIYDDLDSPARRAYGIAYDRAEGSASKGDKTGRMYNKAWREANGFSRQR